MFNVIYNRIPDTQNSKHLWYSETYQILWKMVKMLQVQCVICDTIHTIKDCSTEAKRLKNRRTHTYLCEICYERIKKNTLKRHQTGKFKLYNGKNNYSILYEKNIHKNDEIEP